MNKPKYIKDWKELKEEKSLTYILEIEIDNGCGWIRPNDSMEDIELPHYYLSTHTFYSNSFKHSTRVLQSCGFNVTLANWDEIEI